MLLSTKRRWAGKKTGPNPTDRAKGGTKRHHLTDTGGIPLAVALTAANRPDKETIGALLDARIVRPPPDTEQHLCLDKGYDYADAEQEFAVGATYRTSAGAVRSGASVVAVLDRDGGSPSVLRPGSIAAGSCLYGGRRSRRTTSHSSISLPRS